MASRVTILTALTSILDTLRYSDDIAKVKNTQTDFMSEPAYPVLYVLVGDESRDRRNTGNGYRSHIELIVRIAAKGNQGEEQDVLNPLIEAVFDKIASNDNLNTTVLDAYVSDVNTDQGTAYPYALAEIIIKAMYVE